MRAALAATVLLAGCASGVSPTRPVAVHVPPVGINPVLEGPIAAAPGHALVVGDINLAPGAAIPRHRHAGEEFLYVIGGSATLSRAGEADLVLAAGDGVRIAPDSAHWGTAGPQGLRAISSWLLLPGRPLREAAPE
ncbi:Cupin domain protein [Tsuneonella dongtanensis]|uniref:Cupin domain protein n=1 Tax=Tsuneonella dongtanensis TaxID=692370 RepID=A0A1B2AAD0_9SPHN|nr:cupin domain-containing protein [Tsuneonella dongtanensis]ANY19119.1 Cupin domain protein [Tsuneonella dongtanensis]